MRCCVACALLFLLVGCASDDSGPVQPASLTPEEEQAILERMNQNARQEVPPPAEK